MHKAKITRGEKWLLGVTVCGVALAAGMGLWHYKMDTSPALNIPTPILPSPNAFDYYVKAGKAHDALLRATPGAEAVDQVTDTTSRVGMTPQQLAKIYPTAAKEAWVQKNAPALQTLRQGFKYRYLQPPSRSFVAVFPFLAQYRKLARLLIIESHTRSERGDWAGASRSTLDILHLGHDVPRGGVLITSLVGSAINAIGRRELQDILPHLDAAASREAATTIENLERRRVSHAETLQEEEWGTLASLQETMRRPHWRSEFLPMVVGGGEAPTWRDRLRMQLVSRKLILDNYTHYMDALITEAKKPYACRQTVPIPDDPVNAVIAPVFSNSRWNAARDETGNTLLAVQLAIRAFKLERGAFPNSLRELIPGYLKKLPLDPFGGGGTLCYRKTGDTYLLYSVGPDGRDDGGKAIDDPGRARPSNPKARYLIGIDSKGDYLAGVNR